MLICPRGASQQIGEIYTKIFIAVHIPFFTNLPAGQTFWWIFARDGSNDVVSGKGMPFWG